jgi:hypothetical protein
MRSAGLPVAGAYRAAAVLLLLLLLLLLRSCPPEGTPRAQQSLLRPAVLAQEALEREYGESGVAQLLQLLQLQDIQRLLPSLRAGAHTPAGEALPLRVGPRHWLLPTCGC